MSDYRKQAREYLERAKTEMAGGDDYCLRYAALDLRFAIEALTYDRAVAYKDELPPSEYETWQPRKLMDVLLQINPDVDVDCTLAFGEEDEPGKPAEIMKPLGEETVFNLKLIKSHYNALGSYLHVPSLKQAQNAPPSLKKLRERCGQVAFCVEKALASSVWNITLGNFTKIDCLKCGAVIRKRIISNENEFSARCFKCNVTYKIKDEGNGKIRWDLDVVDMACANSDCTHTINILREQFKPNVEWTCPKCTGRNRICLGIVFKDNNSKNTGIMLSNAIG